MAARARRDHRHGDEATVCPNRRGHQSRSPDGCWSLPQETDFGDIIQGKAVIYSGPGGEDFGVGERTVRAPGPAGDTSRSSLPVSI